MSTEKQRQIEQRAYALWQAEGRPDGKHEEHWHRAAHEVEAEERVVGEAEKPGRRQSTRRAGRGPGALRRKEGNARKPSRSSGRQSGTNLVNR